ncbi:MAG TPA: response regulator [Burkholderiaceae bacterium]|nr:response regulator [Burkholderiaceae bacterium]
MLIVDDNAMNIAIAEVVLLAEKFAVETAVDGLDAIQKVASFGPDLILMDIQMPGMNGLELTRQVKADPATRHIRIIAFTAFAMTGDEAKMRAAGCDGYLSKPIDVAKFGAQVLAFLQVTTNDVPGKFRTAG